MSKSLITFIAIVFLAGAAVDADNILQPGTLVIVKVEEARNQ